MNKPKKIRVPLPKKTEQVHKDTRKSKLDEERLREDAEDIRAEQARGPQNNEEDTELSLETICCGGCGYEYDRHIGDECPACGHNNHEQYAEKYGE